MVGGINLLGSNHSRKLLEFFNHKSQCHTLGKRMDKVHIIVLRKGHNFSNIFSRLFCRRNLQYKFGSLEDRLYCFLSQSFETQKLY